jgi:glycerol-3-phosphate acyltransferase PlsX
MMKVVLDAMGSDTHPGPEVQAAIDAVELWGDPIILSGPKEELEERIQALGGDLDKIEIAHAPEVLTMTDNPAETARRSAANSMAVGIDLVKNGYADAFVTAGNTGGAMATALFRLGRIRGVKRPGLAPTLPVMGGQVIMIDLGANTDCKPEYLVQFAVMGSVYAERVFNKSRPRIALLSNGEEPGKGNELVKETFPLLEKTDLNFIGNVEPKDVYAGDADVVVSDGFVGNIYLKTSEAIAKFLVDMIRTEIKASPITSLGGLIAKPAFKKVGKLLDPAEYGGVPLLGVNGVVYIGHGRSESYALLNAIRAARTAIEGGILEATQDAIKSRFTA